MKVSISCLTLTYLVFSVAVPTQALTVEDGEVVSTNNLYISGEVLVTDPGSMLEASSISIGSGSSFDYGNRLLINNGGTVHCNNSMYINGTVSTGVNYEWLYSYASINGAGSLLEINGDLSLWSSELPGRTPGTWDPWGVPCRMEISNGGAVSVSGSISLINHSSLNLRSGGTLTVGSDFDATMDNFYFESGSTLAVNGQVRGLSLLSAEHRLETANLLGDLTVDGVFSPGLSPTDSMVDGALTISEHGILEMELGGYESGSEYDRLTVTDSTDLFGGLELVFLNEFIPTYGSSFNLFNWDGGVNGTFSSITPLTGDLEWDTSELYTTGTLSVIPEPSAASLIGVFGIGCWFVRNRFLI
ncbi:hypothetical protein P4C99_20985 [Pontiellaceae bacterium B1224]|nr:hypothetical protein [Pontiellaceae bacterium B1224]